MSKFSLYIDSSYKIQEIIRVDRETLNIGRTVIRACGQSKKTHAVKVHRDLKAAKAVGERNNCDL